MPIISSRIARTHNGGGRIAVHEEHTDHDGKVHEHRYHCQSDYDINAALSGNAANVLSSIIFLQKEDVLFLVGNNKNPAGLSYSELTDDDIIEATAKAVMEGRAGDVIEGSKFLQDVPNPTLDSIFDIATRNRINARVNNIVVNEANIKADENQREEL